MRPTSSSIENVGGYPLLTPGMAGRTGEAPSPSLEIGMPVGFVGVAESKNNLADSDLTQIRLDGSRGGAGLVAATVNALLRASISVN